MATKQQQQEPEFERKITAKVMLGEHGAEGGLGEKLFARLMKEKAVPLYNLYGVVKAGRPKTNDYGESVRFIGQFEAESLLDKGRVVRSASCYVPKYLEEELYGLLSAHGANGEAGTVKFAFEIGIKLDMSAATKYVYTARPLMKAQGASDEIALLRAEIAGKALPAPKGEK